MKKLSILIGLIIIVSCKAQEPDINCYSEEAVNGITASLYEQITDLISQNQTLQFQNEVKDAVIDSLQANCQTNQTNCDSLKIEILNRDNLIKSLTSYLYGFKYYVDTINMTIQNDYYYMNLDLQGEYFKFTQKDSTSMKILRYDHSQYDLINYNYIDSVGIIDSTTQVSGGYIATDGHWWPKK